jgi:hypothetical protein
VVLVEEREATYPNTVIAYDNYPDPLFNILRHHLIIVGSSSKLVSLLSSVPIAKDKVELKSSA